MSKARTKGKRTKQELRERIWTLLEKRHAARFPGARGRIPNFIGAEKCAAHLDELKEWKRAAVIKCNPDSPQRQIRWKALKEGKILYMAVPRLAEENAFLELDPQKLGVKAYEASSIKGAFRHGKPVALKDMKRVDLVVCGSVVVNRSGIRIGKGEGYSELEFALLIEAGKLERQVTVLTSVHPLQIVEEVLERDAHDFAVNYILTPDEAIRCGKDKQRPTGIYWSELTPQKIKSIPVLRGPGLRRQGAKPGPRHPKH